MPFSLPDLPFAKDALGAFMSAETLDFHHGKHHKAYVDKTNALLEEQGRPGRRLADRGDPRGEGEGRQGPVQQQPPSSGTTASSGNASRRPRGSGRPASSPR